MKFEEVLKHEDSAMFKDQWNARPAEITQDAIRLLWEKEDKMVKEILDFEIKKRYWEKRAPEIQKEIERLEKELGDSKYIPANKRKESDEQLTKLKELADQSKNADSNLQATKQALTQLREIIKEIQEDKYEL